MTKKDSNAHRKGKVQFSAFLTPPEAVQVDRAKRATKTKTNKELLLWLLQGV